MTHLVMLKDYVLMLFTIQSLVFNFQLINVTLQYICHTYMY